MTEPTTSTPPNSTPLCNHESLKRLSYSMSIHSNNRSVAIQCGDCDAKWHMALDPKSPLRTWTTPQYDAAGKELHFIA